MVEQKPTRFLVVVLAFLSPILAGCGARHAGRLTEVRSPVPQEIWLPASSNVLYDRIKEPVTTGLGAPCPGWPWGIVNTYRIDTSGHIVSRPREDDFPALEHALRRAHPASTPKWMPVFRRKCLKRGRVAPAGPAGESAPFVARNRAHWVVWMDARAERLLLGSRVVMSCFDVRPCPSVRNWEVEEIAGTTLTAGVVSPAREYRDVLLPRHFRSPRSLWRSLADIGLYRPDVMRAIAHARSGRKPGWVRHFDALRAQSQ